MERKYTLVQAGSGPDDAITRALAKPSRGFYLLAECSRGQTR